MMNKPRLTYTRGSADRPELVDDVPRQEVDVVVAQWHLGVMDALASKLVQLALVQPLQALSNKKDVISSSLKMSYTVKYSITCETGGSWRSICSFSTSDMKSDAWNMTVSFTVRFTEDRSPQLMAFNKPGRSRT